MSPKTIIFTTLCITLMVTNPTTSLRDFPINPVNTASVLATEGAGDTNDCWSALSEIRQCSNEIIAFFLNGQTDIDTPCCDAIEFITNQCWPSMLGVLGFTSQEGTLLAGYCNKAAVSPASAPLTTVNLN